MSFAAFVSTNLDGFIFITQLAVKQMLSQGTGGSVTSITAALAENPIAGIPASIPMITKGGLNAITRSLAIEYAKKNIRFNAVAPGQGRHRALTKTNQRISWELCHRWARSPTRRKSQMRWFF